MGERANSDKVPAIAAIVKRVRWICQSELERLERKRPQMPRAEHEELEQMLHRIEEQIVRPVIVELEAVGARERSQAGQFLVAQLFGIS